jgi:hypothetical protein
MRTAQTGRLQVQRTDVAWLLLLVGLALSGCSAVSADSAPVFIGGAGGEGGETTPTGGRDNGPGGEGTGGNAGRMSAGAAGQVSAGAAGQAEAGSGAGAGNPEGGAGGAQPGTGGVPAGSGGAAEAGAGGVAVAGAGGVAVAGAAGVAVAGAAGVAAGAGGMSLAGAAGVAGVAGAPSETGGAGGHGGTECQVPVDLLPVPITDASSPFTEVDDASLAVAFELGFDFTFYGRSYDTVYLNTNGAMTFGAGNSEYDPAASDVTEPGIAVFWGDMHPAVHDADTRPNQMVYQQCSDRFVVVYTSLQDRDERDWDNTAKVTLLADGSVEIQYGEVLSADILVGVFDGTHTNDQTLSLQSSYADYSSLGTGVILFDDHGAGPTHAGELSNQTITFSAQ